MVTFCLFFFLALYFNCAGCLHSFIRRTAEPGKAAAVIDAERAAIIGLFIQIETYTYRHRRTHEYDINRGKRIPFYYIGLAPYGNESHNGLEMLDIFFSSYRGIALH